jgi:hypothetical protein
MEWPVDILVQLLGWLACDGSVTFQHLAYLTINNSQLKTAASRVERPLVLDVHIDGSTRDNQFFIPFFNAQTVNIRIDWGDGTEEDVSNLTMKEVSLVTLLHHEYDPSCGVVHGYTNTGDYVIRVFPA